MICLQNPWQGRGESMGTDGRGLFVFVEAGS